MIQQNSIAAKSKWKAHTEQEVAKNTEGTPRQAEDEAPDTQKYEVAHTV